MSNETKEEVIVQETAEIETATSSDEAVEETVVVEGEDAEDLDKIEYDENGDVVDDGKVVEAIEYNNLSLEDDGILGVPTFTAKELHVIKNNLNLDPSFLTMHANIMGDIRQNLKDVESDAEDRDEQLRKLMNVYNSSRNILVEMKKSYDEYIEYVKENQEEILKYVNDDISKVIKEYVDTLAEEVGIEYVEGTLMSFLIAANIKRRVASNCEDDNIANILATGKKTYEDEVLKLVNTMTFFVSNNRDSRDVNEPSFEEREVTRVATRVIRTMKAIEIKRLKSEYDDLRGDLLLTNHVVNLNELVGRKAVHKFLGIRAEQKKKNKRAKQDLHLDHKYLKDRFNATVVELIMKDWFSLTMYNDTAVMRDRDEFLKRFSDKNSYDAREVLIATINSYSYLFLFDELTRLVSKTSEVIGRHINVGEKHMLRSYLLFVALPKWSDKDAENLYDIDVRYNEYVEIVGTKVHDKLLKKQMIIE